MVQPRKGVLRWFSPNGDVDAHWGVKHSVKSKEGGIEYFFGYKVHTIADVNYGIPLGFVLTPGNKGGTQLLPTVLRKSKQVHRWLQPQFLLADRG